MNSLQDALRIFVTAADAKNFRDAATRLSLSPQAVTRAIQRLEDHFGETLFHRTTRQTRITEFGLAKAAEASASLQQLDEVLRPAEKRIANELAGRVRITAPHVLGRLLVLPVLTRLAAAHPAISVDIRLSDTLSDAVDEQIDIGVRMGFLSHARAVMRRVGKVGFGVYGSPDLISRVGTPSSVDALSEVPTSALINRNTNRPWHWFFSRDRTALPQQAAFITDDPAAECEAALAGIAFAQLPDYLARPHARAGRLIEVLDRDAPAPWDLMVYRPQRGPVPARVRLVFDAIVSGLKEDGQDGS